MKTQKTESASGLADGHKELVQLWILRILQVDPGFARLFDREGYADHDIAIYLGLGERLRVPGEEFPREAIVSQLKALQEKLEALDPPPRPMPVIDRNLRTFTDMLHLGAVDRAVFEFHVMVELEPVLLDTITQFKSMQRRDYRLMLSRALGLPGSARPHPQLSGISPISHGPESILARFRHAGHIGRLRLVSSFWNLELLIVFHPSCPTGGVLLTPRKELTATPPCQAQGCPHHTGDSPASSD